MKRVAPSVRMKEGVERLLRGEGPEGDDVVTPMQGFVGWVAQYMLQVAIEAEATTFLGRGHYRRGARVRTRLAKRVRAATLRRSRRPVVSWWRLSRRSRTGNARTGQRVWSERHGSGEIVSRQSRVLLVDW